METTQSQMPNFRAEKNKAATCSPCHPNLHLAHHKESNVEAVASPWEHPLLVHGASVPPIRLSGIVPQLSFAAAQFFWQEQLRCEKGLVKVHHYWIVLDGENFDSAKVEPGAAHCFEIDRYFVVGVAAAAAAAAAAAVVAVADVVER